MGRLRGGGLRGEGGGSLDQRTVRGVTLRSTLADKRIKRSLAESLYLSGLTFRLYYPEISHLVLYIQYIDTQRQYTQLNDLFTVALDNRNLDSILS